jgi:hypothetical protein
LHEYVDVFAGVGNSNKFTFDPIGKGHLKGNGHRGGGFDETDILAVKGKRYSPLISPSREAIDKVRESLYRSVCQE